MADETVSTVTSKGQTTVPKAIRDELHLQSGQQIEWDRCEHGVVVRRHFDRRRLDKWVGHFKDLEGNDPDDLLDDWRGR